MTWGRPCPVAGTLVAPVAACPAPGLSLGVGVWLGGLAVWPGLQRWPICHGAPPAPSTQHRFSSLRMHSRGPSQGPAPPGHSKVTQQCHRTQMEGSHPDGASRHR